ncbi:hypothetical protein, partial [Arsenicibacter rosenii]|uniref:hypothetical protein n=1 Tax=Arsenicibacter rosenii TaxID=1750698 RepID=UPI001160BC95
MARRVATTLTQHTATTVLTMGGNDGGKISYDDNGNILNLSRTFSGTLVDNLSYGYVTNTNRLSGVADAGQLNAGNGFFNQ